MVNLMRKIIIGRVEGLLHEYLFNSTIRSFLFGLILTSIVQSSSATTSIIVPLVGAGILSLEQIFPYVLGANIGTTVTAILAALVTGSPIALTAAFAHMFFNISGTIIFLPLKAIPIAAAKKIGGFMARRRAISIIYVVIFFYVIPLTIIFLKRGGL
jgi:sodium-dependent phosphate cotransporter